MINVFDFDLFNCDFEFCFSFLHYSLECILLTFSLSAAFVLYAVLVLIAVFIIVFHYIPLYGQTHIMCYIGVCSLVGSLSVCIINQVHFFISACLNYGALIYQVQIKVSSFTGNERESCWHCFEAYLFRNQSATISPNMGFYLHCSPLCHHSNELSEQGK